MDEWMDGRKLKKGEKEKERIDTDIFSCLFRHVKYLNQTFPDIVGTVVPLYHCWYFVRNSTAIYNCTFG